MWRKSPAWNEKTFGDLKTAIKTFVPPKGCDTRHVNILLIGPVGAGKSSFFNTVSSVFKERLSSQACCGSAEKSITTIFRSYRVRDGKSNTVLPFRLCDTRGLEESEILDEQELKYVLNGNIFDGYKHGSIKKLEKLKKSKLRRMTGYLLPKYFPEPEIPGFRKRSTFDSEIHCVCFVLDGSTADVLSRSMSHKIKAIQRIIWNKGIPQLFLLTKMDKVCRLVDKDISAIFSSTAVNDLVEQTATLYGVQRCRVLPLKNYEIEGDVSMEINILVMLSLKYMLSCAEDYLFDMMDRNTETRASDEVL